MKIIHHKKRFPILFWMLPECGICMGVIEIVVYVRVMMQVASLPFVTSIGDDCRANKG